MGTVPAGFDARVSPLDSDCLLIPGARRAGNGKRRSAGNGEAELWCREEVQVYNGSLRCTPTPPPPYAYRLAVDLSRSRTVEPSIVRLPTTSSAFRLRLPTSDYAFRLPTTTPDYAYASLTTVRGSVLTLGEPPSITQISSSPSCEPGSRSLLSSIVQLPDLPSAA